MWVVFTDCMIHGLVFVMLPNVFLKKVMKPNVSRGRIGNADSRGGFWASSLAATGARPVSQLALAVFFFFLPGCKYVFNALTVCFFTLLCIWFPVYLKPASNEFINHPWTATVSKKASLLHTWFCSLVFMCIITNSFTGVASHALSLFLAL